MLKAIQKILKYHATPEARSAHQKFVPGTEKIYGVRTPVLNELAREYKKGGFELAAELWNAGALEEKIIGAKMLGVIAKTDPVRAISLFRDFAEGIQNWAVCDTLGMQSLKPLFKTHQEIIFSLARKYNKSRDPWQRRLSLVLAEWYTRDKACHPAILQLVRSLEN